MFQVPPPLKKKILLMHLSGYDVSIDTSKNIRQHAPRQNPDNPE